MVVVDEVAVEVGVVGEVVGVVVAVVVGVAVGGCGASLTFTFLTRTLRHTFTRLRRFMAVSKCLLPACLCCNVLMCCLQLLGFPPEHFEGHSKSLPVYKCGATHLLYIVRANLYIVRT